MLDFKFPSSPSKPQIPKIKVQFQVEGDGKVHITGYYEPEGDDAESDIDSEEEAALMKELEEQEANAVGGATKVGKKGEAKTEEEEEESSSEEDEVYTI